MTPDDAFLYEIKEARKSHTISARSIKALFQRAVRQERLPLYLIYWPDLDVTLECRILPGGRALID